MFVNNLHACGHFALKMVCAALLFARNLGSFREEKQMAVLLDFMIQFEVAGRDRRLLFPALILHPGSSPACPAC